MNFEKSKNKNKPKENKIFRDEFFEILYRYNTVICLQAQGISASIYDANPVRFNCFLFLLFIIFFIHLWPILAYQKEEREKNFPKNGINRQNPTFFTENHLHQNGKRRNRIEKESWTRSFALFGGAVFQQRDRKNIIKTFSASRCQVLFSVLLVRLLIQEMVFKFTG